MVATGENNFLILANYGKMDEKSQALYIEEQLEKDDISDNNLSNIMKKQHEKFSSCSKAL